MSTGARATWLKASTIAIAVVAALSFGGGRPAFGTPAIPCRGVVARQLRSSAMDIVQLRTFTVEVKPLAKTYKIGGPAKVAVTVTRPAHGDPLQLGPELDPPATAPAANVSVGVGVHLGDVFVPGFGITDEAGETTIAVKLPSYMKPGVADLDGYAWKNQVDSPCMTIEEDGYTHLVKGFSVTR
jgi:hypothetical protein